MTSEMADPQPHHDQGPTPTHAQDTGPNLIVEALQYGLRGWLVLLSHGGSWTNSRIRTTVLHGPASAETGVAGS